MPQAIAAIERGGMSEGGQGRRVWIDGGRCDGMMGVRGKEASSSHRALVLLASVTATPTRPPITRDAVVSAPRKQAGLAPITADHLAVVCGAVASHPAVVTLVGGRRLPPVWPSLRARSPVHARPRSLRVHTTASIKSTSDAIRRACA
jgi:hypothetical protein